MGYDPMGTLNWGAFWKVAGGIAVAVVAVAVVVASCGSALAIGTALVGGYAIGSNVATVIESNIYVKNNKAEAMSESEFESVNSDGKTIGLSRVEKLQYIRYIRGHDSTISNNWSEAQMLREFEYHDRIYNISRNIFNISDDKFPSENSKFVNFEEEQNARTYLIRFIGNMIP